MDIRVEHIQGFRGIKTPWSVNGSPVHTRASSPTDRFIWFDERPELESTVTHSWFPSVHFYYVITDF